MDISEPQMSEDFGRWVWCKSCERMVSLKYPCEHFVPLDEGALKQRGPSQQASGSKQEKYDAT